MNTNLMTIKKGFYFSLLVLSTLFFSCEKDKDPLEACRLDPTCEYFTCKVNGVRWEPQCDGGPLFGCTPWDVQYYKSSGNLEAIIKNENTRNGFKLELRDIKINKIQHFENDSGFYLSNNSEDCIFYNLIQDKNNEVIVQTIDTLNFYIKAKFSMSVINICGEKINITDGEFNLPYRF